MYSCSSIHFFSSISMDLFRLRLNRSKIITCVFFSHVTNMNFMLTIVLVKMIGRFNRTAHICKTSALATYSGQSFLREIYIANFSYLGRGWLFYCLQLVPRRSRTQNVLVRFLQQPLNTRVKCAVCTDAINLKSNVQYS